MNLEISKREATFFALTIVFKVFYGLPAKMGKMCVCVCTFYR